jgi:radical SAM superfamily enzyme YgiQ (UPF0313 family)
MNMAGLKNSDQIKDWFAKERLKLSGKGVWLQGGEPNTLNPLFFDKASLKVLFVRLSSYSDVSAGITHQYLYQMGASVEDCYIDMAFLPPERDEQLMKEAGIPLLVGTTSKEPAMNFDVVAISNSVLQELVNLPAMLEFSGIPLSREERAEANAPIILLGGSNSCTHSILHGEIIGNGKSGLVDGVQMGDGEQVFAQALRLIRDNKRLSRKELMKLLRDRVTGFYEPSSYSQIFEKGELTKINFEEGSPFPVKSSKTACSEKSETFTGGPLLYEGAGASHVIVSAGCPSFCSFCKESWEQKPYRENSYHSVYESALKLKANLGLSEIALMTFNANTCSDVFRIISELGDCFERVSIKSQRFDAIVNAPELLDLQFDAGKRTYTCAMEGISNAMRSLLQKNLDEETILKGIDLLMQRNMRQMKVFLILTGYETQEDINEFKAFLDKIGIKTQSGKNKPKITFSFAVLFRSPQTPMQFAGNRADYNKMKAFLNELCKIIKTAGYEARISSGPEDALVSEFIAYSDRRFTKVLVEASIKYGARYRGEIDSKLLKIWQNLLDKYSLPLVSEKNRCLDSVLPWDDVDTGISKEFLWRTFNNVKNGKEIRACLSKPWGDALCAGCGACKTLEYRDRLHKMGPDLANKKAVVPKNIKRYTSWFSFEIPEKWAFCSREFIKAAFARRLMLDSEEMTKAFLKVELVAPEIFSYGKAIAKVSFANDVKEVKNLVCDDDISNIKKIMPSKKEEETTSPIVLEVSEIIDKVAYSREVDAILTKYSLKNQKQRANGWLNWQINSGQAKKAGISKISLNEETGTMRMMLIKMPELFLLNKLSMDKPFYVCSIGG